MRLGRWTFVGGCLLSLVGTATFAPLASAQTLCDPAYADACVPPGEEGPLAVDCGIWETGYVIIAPPDACLPPLGPAYP
jgi:hypothetical protein